MTNIKLVDIRPPLNNNKMEAKTNKKMEKIEFVNLKSVGSIIKLKTETIYPLQTNGKPDLSMGILLDDCEDEWFGSLSDYDLGTISNILNNR